MKSKRLGSPFAARSRSGFALSQEARLSAYSIEADRGAAPAGTTAGSRHRIQPRYPHNRGRTSRAAVGSRKDPHNGQTVRRMM